jgi:hypothetical protein
MKADGATCCAGVTDRARDHHHGPLDANLELLFCDPGRFNFTPKVRLAARLPIPVLALFDGRCWRSWNSPGAVTDYI